METEHHPADSTRHMNVLHIDDDEDIREIVGLSLGLDEQMSVRTMCDSAGVLAFLAGEEWVPDCLLMDVRLSTGDGRALLEQIRLLPRYRSTPVIFLTASVSQADVAKFHELGASGFIAKPFDPLGLAGKIRTMLSGADPA